MATTGHSIASLRLNMKAAQDGKTWLLLPEGFRDQEHGQNYPLPGQFLELQRLSIIYIAPNKKDSGSIYLRRAVEAFKEKQRHKIGIVNDIAHREDKIKRAVCKLCKKSAKQIQEVFGSVSVANLI